MTYDPAQITARGPRADAEASAAAIDTDVALEGATYSIIEEDEARGLWRIDAFPTSEDEDDALQALLARHPLQVTVEPLGDADWLAMALSGLPPVRAGRFFVHTPMHYADRPADTVNFEIDAGLAFGTGQHATTAGCLAALDTLAFEGRAFENVADIGTGTGLLAFAALALWPQARSIATDIDPIAVDVSRDNAAINHVRLGHGAGELLLAVADGMDSAMLAARAPFDLIIANILAGPLIELAPDFAKALAPRGTVVLAGLLDTQSDAVIAAYEAKGVTCRVRGSGDWPVLVLSSAQADPA